MSMYISVDGVAREVNHIFYGTQNYCYDITTAYVGIGDVAKAAYYNSDPYSRGLAHLYMTASIGGVTNLAGTSFNCYGLFGGGGGTFSYYSQQVKAVDGRLTISNLPNMSQGRELLGATSISTYSIFGGGSSSNNTFMNNVDVYNTSLTHSTADVLSSARNSVVGTTVNNYGLFGGGFSANGTYTYSEEEVDAYDSNLTHSKLENLIQARRLLTATSIGDYALFGGGVYYYYNPNSSMYELSNKVDAYNGSLTRSTPTTLSVARCDLASTQIRNYALFGGGSGTDGISNIVDTYNSSLTRSTTTGLSVARRNLVASSLDTLGLFGGVRMIVVIVYLQ